MLNFIVAGLTALGIVFFLGYELSCVHCPAGLERKIVYRANVVTFKLISILAILCRIFGITREAIAYRYLAEACFAVMKHLSSRARQKKSLYGIVESKDLSFEGVHVRLYTSKYELERISDTNNNLTSSKEKEEVKPIIIYFHGGAWIGGSVDIYDTYTRRMAELANFPVISVNYRLAPEFPYPTGLNDSWNVIQYVLKNAKTLNVDTSKIILAGDSAGANFVASMTQRLRQDKQYQQQVPKLQVLITPNFQCFNLDLASFQHYQPRGLISRLTFSFGKFPYWYFGYDRVSRDMRVLWEKNLLRYAIDDEETRDKFCQMTDDEHVPAEYKRGRSYYEANVRKRIKINEKDKQWALELFRKDPMLKQVIQTCISTDLSPSLADDSILKNLPPTYMIVVEYDPFKDDSLIYASRMRKCGIDVRVAYYEHAFHSIPVYVDRKYGFSEAIRIQDNLMQYILENIHSE